jgi:hypothetical protein
MFLPVMKISVVPVTITPDIWYILLTAIGLTHGGSSTVHIYTQTVQKKHNETEYTEQNMHNKKNIKI